MAARWGEGGREERGGGKREGGERGGGMEERGGGRKHVRGQEWRKSARARSVAVHTRDRIGQT